MDYEYLKSHYPNYEDMVNWCTNGRYVSASEQLVHVLTKDSSEDPKTYCGCRYEYLDEDGNEISEKEANARMDKGEEIEKNDVLIMQYFIISEYSAEMFEKFTNEIVLYFEEVGMYLLCVTHLGTPWESVRANWKEGE